MVSKLKMIPLGGLGVSTNLPPQSRQTSRAAEITGSHMAAFLLFQSCTKSPAMNGRSWTPYLSATER